MATFTVKAFAKINLSLRIEDARADGFHDVQTILQSIELHDSLRIDTRKGPFAIACTTQGVPTDRSNLIWKAAAAVWRAAGKPAEPKDVLITLRKRIPMQAGLGGGSTDAAATLLALRRLWQAPLPDDELQRIASSLGADVPFFLRGGTALGLGKGDEIYPLVTPGRWWVVLLLPRFGVPTADAYRWLDEDRRTVPQTPAVSLLPGTWLGRLPLINDLEAPVVRRHPQIAALRNGLLERNAVMAAMSGSGSTVFGLFSSRTRAEAAAKALARSATRALITRTVNPEGCP